MKKENNSDINQHFQMVFLTQLLASPSVKVELAGVAFKLTSTDHTQHPST